MHRCRAEVQFPYVPLQRALGQTLPRRRRRNAGPREARKSCPMCSSNSWVVWLAWPTHQPNQREIHVIALPPVPRCTAPVVQLCIAVLLVISSLAPFLPAPRNNLVLARLLALTLFFCALLSSGSFPLPFSSYPRTVLLSSTLNPRATSGFVMVKMCKVVGSRNTMLQPRYALPLWLQCVEHRLGGLLCGEEILRGLVNVLRART